MDNLQLLQFELQKPPSSRNRTYFRFVLPQVPLPPVLPPAHQHGRPLRPQVRAQGEEIASFISTLKLTPDEIVLNLGVPKKDVLMVQDILSNAPESSQQAADRAAAEAADATTPAPKPYSKKATQRAAKPLDNSERARLYEEKRCFYCRGSGHTKKHCFKAEAARRRAAKRACKPANDTTSRSADPSDDAEPMKI